MKHIYTLVLTFFSLFQFAQVTDPQTLVGKDWRLFKITSGTTEYLPPSTVPILQSRMLDSNGTYNFYPRYYNSGTCYVAFTNNENSFTYQYSQFPFIYEGENSEAVNAYDVRMLDFYRLYVGQKYTYVYSAESTVQYLTITNPAGDKMFFRNTNLLATGEASKPDYQVYPNPVKDVLKINSDESIKLFNITDTTGRVMMQKDLNGKSREINVQNLNPGVYYLKINNGKAQKIIKQ